MCQIAALTVNGLKYSRKNVCKLISLFLVKITRYIITSGDLDRYLLYGYTKYRNAAKHRYPINEIYQNNMKCR